MGEPGEAVGERKDTSRAAEGGQAEPGLEAREQAGGSDDEERSGSEGEGSEGEAGVEGEGDDAYMPGDGTDNQKDGQANKHTELNMKPFLTDNKSKVEKDVTSSSANKTHMTSCSTNRSQAVSSQRKKAFKKQTCIIKLDGCHYTIGETAFRSDTIRYIL